MKTLKVHVAGREDPFGFSVSDEKADSVETALRHDSQIIKLSDGFRDHLIPVRNVTNVQVEEWHG